MTSDKDYRSGIARIAASLPLLASSWTLQQLLAIFFFFSIAVNINRRGENPACIVKKSVEDYPRDKPSQK